MSPPISFLGPQQPSGLSSRTVGVEAPRRRERQMVRLLGMLKLFAEGARPSVYDLAARFHVRRETVYRDLHTLEAAGFPIAGDEAGRLSRPRFAVGAHPALPPVALTPQELAALVWAARHTEPRQA